MSRPEISRISPFEYNEAVQIFGEGFTENSKVYWWRADKNESRDDAKIGLPGQEALPEFPPEDARVFNVSAVAPHVLYIYAHNHVPWGNAVMWVETDGEISKPHLANKTAIWNQSLSRVYPGGVVSFYGEGMWSRDAKRACLKNKKTGEYIMAPTVEVEEPSYFQDWHLYRTNVAIPQDTPDGDYEVYVYSGFGGNFGWSDAAELTVTSKYNITEYYRTLFNRNMCREIPMPQCPIYSLPANILGANYDITDELQALLDKAHESENGAIVMLGAGTYAISRTLELRKGTVLMGAGEGATTICAVNGCEFKADWSKLNFAKAIDQYSEIRNSWAVDWEPHWKRYNHSALIQIFEDAGLNNIHLELGHGANFGVIVSNNNEECHSFGAFLNKVNVDGGGLYAFWDNDFGGTSVAVATVSSTTEFTLFDCNLKASSPLTMLPAYNLRSRIIRNNLHHTSRQSNESFICGLHYSVIEENDCHDGRRSLCTQNGFENNWVFMNKSSGVSRSRCGSEVYMSEYGSADWGGYASEIGEDYIGIPVESGIFDAEHSHEVLAKESFYLRVMNMGIITPRSIKEYPRYVCILDGKGFGQYRKVSKVEGNRLYLDKPWDVLPDSTTAFTVVVATANNMWIDNDSSMSCGHSQFVYGCGVNNIISGHECYMSAGILNQAMGGYVHTPTIGVFCFNRILHTAIRSSGKGISLQTGSRNRKNTDPDFARKTGGVFGNTIAKCAIDGSRNLLYTKNEPDWSDPRPKAGIAIDGGYNTLTDNHIGGYKVGIRIADDCPANCLDNNVYEDVDVNVTAVINPKGDDLRHGNVYIR